MARACQAAAPGIGLVMSAILFCRGWERRLMNGAGRGPAQPRMPVAVPDRCRARLNHGIRSCDQVWRACSRLFALLQNQRVCPEPDNTIYDP